MKISNLVEQFKTEVSVIKKSKDYEKVIINRPGIYRGGLELTGWFEAKIMNNLIIWGSKEMAYFERFSDEELLQKFKKIDKSRPPAIILSVVVPEKYIKLITKGFPHITIIQSKWHVRETVDVLSSALNFHFHDKINVHASLIKILDTGVLIIGDSGAGKSEAILELLNMGHIFIGDDSIDLHTSGHQVYGTAAKITEGFLEARGLGLISIPYIYGIRSMAKNTEVRLVVELTPTTKENRHKFDRIGLNELRYNVREGVSLPCIQIPVAEGRSTANLIVVAVYMFLAGRSGVDPMEIIKQRMVESDE